MMSLENVKNIVLILSGKGGVGKSSITTQLALSLSLAGHSVGILDIDLTGPSIPRLLGVESAKITQAPGGWLPVEVHRSQILPALHTAPEGPSPAAEFAPPATTSKIPNGGTPRSTITVEAAVAPVAPPQQSSKAIGALHVMSLGFLLPSRSSAVVWRGPKKTAMVRQFLTSVLWPPNLSYLLIDTPPGTSDEHISLAETLLTCCNSSNSTTSSSSSSSAPRLAGAVVVTTPQAVATSDVRKELNFCAKVRIPVLGVVENMSGYVCECCGVGTNLFGKGGGQLMSEDFGVRFLGRVPVDARWGSLVEEGKRPVYGAPGEGDREMDIDDDDDDATSGGGGGGGGDDGTETNAKAGDTNSDLDLLVDKYRSCALSAIFQGITRDLVGVVEGGEGALGASAEL